MCDCVNAITQEVDSLCCCQSMYTCICCAEQRRHVHNNAASWNASRHRVRNAIFIWHGLCPSGMFKHFNIPH